MQWEIFSRLFGGPVHHSPLVLVADPKQAIYAFRGANVHTYLEAAHRPGTTRATLGVNRRSDEALLDALGHLFEGATFGDPRIEYVQVKPASEHRGLRLTTDDGAAVPALRVRLTLGDDLFRNEHGEIPTRIAEAAIARDLARQVQHLLETAWIPSPGEIAPKRRVRPSNVAVLIGTNAEAERVQAALRRLAIPAVVTRSDSVLRSAAATQWRWLLTALTRPADPTRARTAALSCFFGWTVAELDAADDAKLSQVQDQLFRWAETLDAQGTVGFCAKVWYDSGVAARVLATSDGDRDFTDLDHIAGLLQASTAGRRPTAAGLLATLKQLESEAGGDPETDLTARQVESEAEAVRIMTVHAAKGLEFPIVCVPTLWRNSLAVAHEIVFQDPDTGLRTFDIANGEGWPTASDAKARKVRANDEARGENLRLLYVALTRAQHKTLVWWSHVQGCDITGLAHVLFARSNGAIDPELFAAPKVVLPPDFDAAAVLGPVFSRAGDAVAVTVTGSADGPVHLWADGASRASTREIGLAVLDRVLVRANRRWSFSAISDHAREAALDPEDESLGDSGAADEPPEVVPEVVDVVSPGDATPASDLPLGAVAGGAQFGTLVHEVLERVDFASADLEAELRKRIDDRLRWNPWPVGAETLLTGLRAAIETPLGPLFNGQRLRRARRAANGWASWASSSAWAGRDVSRPIATSARSCWPICPRTIRSGPGRSASRRGCSELSSLGISRALSTWSSASAIRPAQTHRLASSSSTTRPTRWPSGAAGPSRPTTTQTACRLRWRSTTTRCKPCSTRSRCTATCAGAFGATSLPCISGVPRTCSYEGWRVPPRQSSTATRTGSSVGAFLRRS